MLMGGHTRHTRPGLNHTRDARLEAGWVQRMIQYGMAFRALREKPKNDFLGTRLGDARCEHGLLRLKGRRRRSRC